MVRYSSIHTIIQNHSLFIFLASADFTPLINEEVALPIGTSLGNQFCTDIQILQDGIPENLESFTVELMSGSPAFVIVNPATNEATVNIIGDCKANKSQNITL